MEETNEMSSNEKYTRKVFEDHKGEMVLVDGNKYQFVGIAQDRDDYLYLMFDGRKITVFTILSHFVILKNKIDYDDYYNFIRTADLNFYTSKHFCSRHREEDNNELETSVNKFIETIETEWEEMENVSMMSDFCWQIH